MTQTNSDRRFETFDRVLDELIDDYVNSAHDAVRAEQTLQRRAQDMREQADRLEGDADA